MNEILINAKFTALIQQRDIAQAAYVNLCGEHAVLQARVQELEAELSAAGNAGPAQAVELSS